MNDGERPQVVLVNRCVIQDDDSRLLLVKRSLQDSNNPGLWEVPGGKLDVGQDLSAALEREVMEETGLIIEPVSPLVYADSFVITKGKYIGLPYVVLFSLGRITGGQLQLSSEHDDHVWETYSKVFNHELTPECEKALRFLGATLLNGQ